VQIGDRKPGWYRGYIEIPTYEPSLDIPKFTSIKERNAWELEKWGSKKVRKETLTKEVVKMFQSKNPKTNKLWTLEEIGEKLGGYKASPIYKLIRETGIQTKRGRNYTGSRKDEQ
jgi:hypothetical protein